MILVDTGPLVALCDPRDRLHTTALSDLTELGATALRVCEAVIVEACVHLPRPAQRARLRALLDKLDIESLPTAAEHFRDDVFAWLTKYSEHEPDWADGCLAVLAAEHPRAQLWTYDREFRTLWRRPDGRGISMAVR